MTEDNMRAPHANNTALNSYLEAGSLLQNELGPFMIDQHIRQAIMHCWIMLPEDERSITKVKDEVLRLFHRAIKDMYEDALAFGFVQQQEEPKHEEDRYAEIRAIYPRAYEAWTVSEDDKLRQKHDQGLMVEQLAKDLQRQPSAITSRLRKLGLS